MYSIEYISYNSPIVGRGKDRNALAIVGHLVAFVLDLVAPDDVVEFVVLQEGLRHVRSELDADSAFGRRSAILGLRVGPQQLAHQALLRRLPVAVDRAQVVQRDSVLREQATVHDENLLVDAVAER